MLHDLWTTGTYSEDTETVLRPNYEAIVRLVEADRAACLPSGKPLLSSLSAEKISFGWFEGVRINCFYNFLKPLWKVFYLGLSFILLLTSNSSSSRHRILSCIGLGSYRFNLLAIFLLFG